ncbi:Probable 2-ketoarginine decarboxylase AruI [Geodia barretti]|uniref:Probable 2-ketoarginine decarboxylase AruI n=1 Tax=Geodia barretti TaxID=519541 RepID=A0AA35RG73_GEOBA|nr:Probable 2-ketoarginine decarboxylase AruI [Geodia barretti]
MARSHACASRGEQEGSIEQARANAGRYQYDYFVKTLGHQLDFDVNSNADRDRIIDMMTENGAWCVGTPDDLIATIKRLDQESGGFGGFMIQATEWGTERTETGIKFITTRHEQATAYMADGYSRSGDDIGTALVVPGPGLQNASAAIGTAFAASSPIMVVAGQVERDMIGVDRGVLHEINDQLDTIRPVTKWAQRILDPRDVPEAVHEAFYQLKSGRPRPVEIEIPPETLADVAEIELLEPVNYQRQAASADSIQRGRAHCTRIQTPQILQGQRVVQIDIDEAELGRNYENTFGIAGDAKMTLEELLKAVSVIKPASESRQAEIEEMREEFFGEGRALEPLHSL